MDETQTQTQAQTMKLDLPTLHTSVAIVSQVGFQHFQLSQDTRLTLEARKAHRFVAINCEDTSRRILRLTGAPETEIDQALQEHAKNLHRLHTEMKKGALKLSETLPGPNNTGSA